MSHFCSSESYLSGTVSFLGLSEISIKTMFWIHSTRIRWLDPLRKLGVGVVTAPRKLDGKRYTPQKAACPSKLPSQAPKDGFNYMPLEGPITLLAKVTLLIGRIGIFCSEACKNSLKFLLAWRCLVLVVILVTTYWSY